MNAAADPVPASPRDYLNNRTLFEEFYVLQEAFVARLAGRPELIRAWLNIQTLGDDPDSAASIDGKCWRGTRLTAARKRKLSLLIADAEGPTRATAPLVEFLLKALAVSTYFAIAGRAGLPLVERDPETGGLSCKLEAMRNRLFEANYGLAKAAIRGRKPYEEYLSAASQGLLDAIDRYNPFDPKSSSFAFFANTFWIRHQVSRYRLKNGTTVSLSINQQRIAKRIERYLESRRTSGLPAPSEAEVCSELKISSNAYYWYFNRPNMVSIDDLTGVEDDHGEPMSDAESLLASADPNPNEEVETSEIAAHLRELLRQNIPAHRRVMMSYHRHVGNLADAMEDYLADLEKEAVENLRRAATALASSPRPVRRLIYAGNAAEAPSAREGAA